MQPLLPKPLNKNVDILLIAGEHSGDDHAARMIAQLKKNNPSLNICAIAGPSSQAAGAQLLHNLTESSVVGLVEVLKNYSFFKQLFNETISWIWKFRPRVICFVDYPGFNLRLAKRLFKEGLAKKAGGDVTLCYYISPQIWAWKAKRRFKMAKWLDALAVIFPFEVDCYKDTSLPTTFVGHPFMEESFSNPLHYDPDAPILLLPGSRKAAVKRILPPMLKAFELFLQKHPSETATLIYPSTEIHQIQNSILQKFPSIANKVKLQSADTLTKGKALLGSSGTMSLKCALAAIPGAILYKAHPMTYAIGRMLVDIDRLGMANILLDRFVYPEFIQQNATPEALAEQLEICIKDPSRLKDTQDAAKELTQILSQKNGLTPASWLESLANLAVWG